MRNASLISAIQKVVGVKASTLFSIAIKFVSTSDSTYAYSPLYIDTLQIKQDYINTYTDDIVIEFPLATADYAKLYAHIQDLHVVLTLTFADAEGRTDLLITPIQQIYRAIIINPRDITKEVSDASRRTEIDTSIRVRLIEDAVYAARQQEIHVIYQTMSIESVIRSLSNSFNMKTLALTTVDNVHKYDHVIIPAMKSFANVFEWLQMKYGIYMCGCNHYFTKNILYIYAPYDTSPTTTNTLTVYQAEKGMYQGSQIYHKTTGTNTELVTNSVLHAHDASVSAGENHGTAASFLRASEIVDGIVTVNNTTGAQFVVDPALTISLNKTKMAQSDTNKTKYTKMTDNPFLLASNLVMHQCIMTRIEWNLAIPYVFTPGQQVVYNSDETGLVRKRSGILEGITYRIGRMPRVSGKDLFACKAELLLRLDPIGTLTSTV